MTPRHVVEAWAFSRAVGLGGMYLEDAINHQVAQTPILGRVAIQANFEREFAAAEMVCIPGNLFEDGDWAILEWRDPKGRRGCGFFQVIGGKTAFQRGDRLSFERGLGPGS